MTALFNLTQPSKPASNTVEFRAGKLNLEGNKVVADSRKGQFTLQFNAENILRLTWTDRTTNVVEDDLMIFKGDAEFVSIPDCKTGRVFLLKWNTCPRRMFFWMQEPDTTKDEGHFKKITELVKNPEPPSASSSRSAELLEKLAAFSGNRSDVFSLAQNLSSRGLGRLLVQDASGALDVNRGVPDVSRITELLLNLGSNNGEAETASSTSGDPTFNDDGTVSFDPKTHILTKSSPIPFLRVDRSQSTTEPNAVDFCRALSWSKLKPLFDKYPEILDNLIDKLPEGRPNGIEEVIASVQSPQYEQTVRMIANTIARQEFDDVASQFEMNDHNISEALGAGNFRMFAEYLEYMMETRYHPERARNSTRSYQRDPLSDDEETSVDDADTQ